MSDIWEYGLLSPILGEDAHGPWVPFDKVDSLLDSVPCELDGAVVLQDAPE